MPSEDLTASDIFDCRQCGDCCLGYGGTYVTDDDIRNIAEYTGEDPDLFVEKFCDISGGKPVLTQNETGKCTFFDEEKQCTIHPVKPRMCRAWPFIEGILKAPGNWELMAGACPGIKTGIPEEDLKRIVAGELAKIKPRT